jgi:hypothetical protein
MDFLNDRRHAMPPRIAIGFENTFAFDQWRINFEPAAYANVSIGFRCVRGVLVFAFTLSSSLTNDWTQRGCRRLTALALAPPEFSDLLRGLVQPILINREPDHLQPLQTTSAHSEPDRQAGMSHEMLAEKAELHPVYVGKIERGEQCVSLHALHASDSRLRPHMRLRTGSADAPVPQLGH